MRDAYVVVATAVLAIWAVGSAEAQGPPGTGVAAESFAQLGSLVKPGQSLEVIQQDGTRVHGVLTELSRSTISLKAAGSTRVLQESTVSRVRRTDTVWNGVALGAGVGAAVAALGAASTRGTSDAFYGYAYVGSWLFPAVGGLVGWVVDRSTGNPVIFERGGTSALHVSPQLAPGRAALTVSWR